MITNLLVANRGEIALRVFRSCREAGIGTVSVFSDADADAPHARAADAAVRLPGAAPSETYLRTELIVEAALATGADAVHPGYGFLSENAGFARAVEAAGLTWVGPSVEAIEVMGSKVDSKRLMSDAGVPVLTELDPSAVTAADLPLLVKASAGGGGRGMRVVRELAELPDGVAAATQEATSAFGDGTVFCEPYLETGRHIEVQVLADTHGTVWALGERECSIQRRHQKVIEEAPSPFVDTALRERLFDAGRAAAKAIGYVGAGTVEFLVAPDGRFYFLEMNTRLQVEHPVTECVTGTDLVAWQLRIAEGAALPIDPPAPRGHAIEARLYAEDPAAQWQPQTGTLHRFDIPGVVAEFAIPGQHGIRLDSGVRSGSEIGVHYDPMLAKVIAWAPNRTSAARALAGALSRARLHGVLTNRDLLVNVLRDKDFLDGDTDTSYFARRGLDTLSRPLAEPDSVRYAALAAALADRARARRSATVLAGLPGGWRNVVSAPRTRSYLHGEDEITVAYRVNRDGELDAADFPDTRLDEAAPEAVSLTIAGVRRRFDVGRYGDLVMIDSPLGPVRLTAKPRFPDPESALAAGSLVAPMPGTVLRVAVADGDSVRAGTPLLWLEAMKMEHQVAAPVDGVVTELVEAGRQVELGAVLAVVTGDTGTESAATEENDAGSGTEEDKS